ncbi:DUF305 domain-containing protein [Pseudarthrobacter niigatensis]|uniref:Uncharacterized protein (DUF305 family) n=1 Tax=Pseudarthrobacter niigatensis TaxID=369935 RepID=A0AAJ1WFK5_9MICC|nr:DUF305 domain-containing protein [Pseudarthrobacter niigatensis]MDQ0146097.1 uncharacterized protein (DUF305 family) [Pseudarthrobacter niigatensis]MDQ0266175.1 uncharacterized protein (DUF305 family) [Pseudarthrobacter niigatensis]
MNTTFKTLSIAAALAASLGLAGCAANAGAGSSMPMDHGSSGAMSSTMPGAGSTPNAGADHNQADIMFAQMMIPHHSQAVEMSDIILAKAGMPADVIALATKIKAAQAPEIKQMTGWLTGWNLPTMMSDHSGHGMAGMVDDDGINKLKSAWGTEAARLFLQQMIGHHEGAIDMSQQEISAGKFPDAVKLGHDIVAAQQAEITQMKQLLAAL